MKTFLILPLPWSRPTVSAIDSYRPLQTTGHDWLTLFICLSLLKEHKSAASAGVSFVSSFIILCCKTVPLLYSVKPIYIVELFSHHVPERGGERVTGNGYIDMMYCGRNMMHIYPGIVSSHLYVLLVFCGVASAITHGPSIRSSSSSRSVGDSWIYPARSWRELPFFSRLKLNYYHRPTRVVPPT